MTLWHNSQTPAVRNAYHDIIDTVQKRRPDAKINGVSIEPFLSRPNGRELMIGVFRDPIFGPVITFGAGGFDVEIFSDRSVALPPLNKFLAKDLIDSTRASKILGQYPGITIGQLTVTPNYGNELITLCQNLINLLAVSLTILLMSFLIYRPVRNALAPSAAMLETLKCMEDGDLQARMPTFALIELDRIGQGFNHLAERLQQTIRTQMP